MSACRNTKAPRENIPDVATLSGHCQDRTRVRRMNDVFQADGRELNRGLGGRERWLGVSKADSAKLTSVIGIASTTPH